MTSTSPFMRPLVRAVRLLAAVGGVAMASTGECDPLFLIVALSFFLVGLKVENAPRLASLLGKLQPVMALGVFALALIDFFYLSNSFLLTVAHFLLSIQGLRLLVLRTARENVGSVLISSMMMLSASTLAVDWTFFVLLSIYLVTVIWALILHALEVGGEGPLEWKPVVRSIRKSCAAAFLVAAACCAFVFVIFPRFNFQGFRGQFLQPVHKSGFSNQVNLEKSGKIFEDNSVVMRVEVDPSERDHWPGYMRGAVLTAFDGKVWRRASMNTERLYRTGSGEFSLPVTQKLSGRRLKQSIYLESMDTPVLFTVPQAVRLRMDRPFIEHSWDGTLQRVHNDSWRIHYEVESVVPDFEKVPAVSWSRKRDQPTRRGIVSLELPARPNERIVALADEWTRGARSDFDIATRIAENLRRNYGYTMEMGLLKTGQDPLERFLFETKQGHCEYFASTMGLMLRIKGIPSRMVTGFHSQEWNKKGNYFVVRMLDAHAWIEAYIEPVGWVSFDPSPRDARASALGIRDRGALGEAWDYLNLRWNRYILSYDLQQQVALFRAVTEKSNRISLSIGNVMGKLNRKWDFSFSGPGKLPWRTVALVLGTLLTATALLLVVIFSWRGWFRRERIWFYRPLLKFLEKKGGRKPPMETLFEFSSRLKNQLQDRWEEIRFLEGEYYRLRFDPEARVSPEEASRIKSALLKLI